MNFKEVMIKHFEDYQGWEKSEVESCFTFVLVESDIVLSIYSEMEGSNFAFYHIGKNKEVTLMSPDVNDKIINLYGY